MHAEIRHPRYPPASVLQALGTTCGHPLTEADMRVFGRAPESRAAVSYLTKNQWRVIEPVPPVSRAKVVCG